MAGCDLPSDADQLQYTITRIDCVLSCDLPSDADQLQFVGYARGQLHRCDLPSDADQLQFPRRLGRRVCWL